jgi:hypothetical protein
VVVPPGAACAGALGSPCCASAPTDASSISAMIAIRAMRDNGEPVASLQGKIAARGGRAKLAHSRGGLGLLPLPPNSGLPEFGA